MTLRALYDVPAPAKLNLFLHVVGRRGDGYHLLQSPLVLVDWCDTLHFETLRDGAIRRRDLGATLPDDDLCLRAARALQAAAGATLGAEIAIDKRLPWGAGLGGGSSDAATTLLALNRLWALRWPRARLAELALTIGADVPFFVGGRNAFVQGIGEALTPLNVPEQTYAVVKPCAAIATRDVFAHPSLVRDGGVVILSGSPDEAGCSSAPTEWLGGFGRNDLQGPAEELCPEVAQAARWLQARYGSSRMTGSGSAVYARVQTHASAPAAFPAQELPPGWVGRMCRSLAVHPLYGWAD